MVFLISRLGNDFHPFALLSFQLTDDEFSFYIIN